VRAEVREHVLAEGARGLNVSDVEQLVVGAAGKIEREAVANPAVDAVAAAEIGDLAYLLGARPVENGADPRVVLRELLQLDAPFDRDPGSFELLDEEAFVIFATSSPLSRRWTVSILMPRAATSSANPSCW
jgi:hypothetical protein